MQHITTEQEIQDVSNLMLGMLVDRLMPSTSKTNMLQEQYFEFALEEIRQTRHKLSIYGIDTDFWEYARKHTKGKFFKKGLRGLAKKIIGQETKNPDVEAIAHDCSPLEIMGCPVRSKDYPVQNTGFMVSDQSHVLYWNYDRKSPVSPDEPFRAAVADRFLGATCSGIIMGLFKYTNPQPHRT